MELVIKRFNQCPAMPGEQEVDLIDNACLCLLVHRYPDSCSSNAKRIIWRKAATLVMRGREVFYMKARKDSRGEKVVQEVRYIHSSKERQRILKVCHVEPTSGHMSIKAYCPPYHRALLLGVINDVEYSGTSTNGALPKAKTSLQRIRSHAPTHFTIKLTQNKPLYSVNLSVP